VGFLSHRSFSGGRDLSADRTASAVGALILLTMLAGLVAWVAAGSGGISGAAWRVVGFLFGFST
jgi:hypothetical protein